MDLIKPFLGASRQTDGEQAAADLNISAHADALRRLLKGPELGGAGNHGAGDGEAQPVPMDPTVTTGPADPR